MRLEFIDDSELLDINLPEFGRLARQLYEAATYMNQLLMRHYVIPPLYEAGIIYRPEGMKQIVSCATVLERGWGSCGHLAAYRVAELREAGKYGAFALRYQGELDGNPTYHVIVRLDGSSSPEYEDPSAILGM